MGSASAGSEESVGKTEGGSSTSEVGSASGKVTAMVTVTVSEDDNKANGGHQTEQISQPQQPSVIRGMDRNVIFFTHKTVSNLGKNENEARLCVMLKKYLISQGYKSEEILIMCTTDEQADLIMNMKDTGNQDILPICTSASSSDGLQDDTNDKVEIVILSAVVNNILVGEQPDQMLLSLFIQKFKRALLRSRVGLYVFGHFSLKILPGPFERFCKLLVKQDSIRNFEGFRPLIITPKKEIFTDIKLCLQKRSCGHPCPRKSHPTDPIHNRPGDICLSLCGRSCPNGHPCPNSCHAVCKPCEVIVKMDLPCGHPLEEKCGLIPEKPICETIISVTLNCGHKADVPCGRVNEHECKAVCLRKIEGCGHTCRKECHEPCRPCQVWMHFTFDKCHHIVFGQCCKVNYKDHLCQEVVKSKVQSDCGHPILIKCFSQGERDSFEVSKCCEYPCKHFTAPKEERGCGHPCSAGSCSECFGGIYHVRCEEPCGRQLICGHICCSGCPADCPPCEQACHTSCEHGKCENDPCGIPCLPCEEPCEWECPHLKCTMECGETCNRPPCELYCPKSLPCGHSCVGFCGEPCSPLCRICDHDTLLGGFFSGEDKILESDRFVYLVNCGHTIEHESLASWMKAEENNGEINPKSCPLCRQIIWTCRRFNQIVLKSFNDVMKVKTKIYGEPEENNYQVRELYRKLKQHKSVTIWDSLPACFKDFRTFLLDLIKSKRRRRSRSLGPVSRVFVESIASLADIYFDGVETLAKIEKVDISEILIKYYERLFRAVSDDDTERPPERSGERADILRETRRIRDLKIFMEFHPSKLPATVKNLFLKEEIQVLHKETFDSLTKAGPYYLDRQYHVAWLLEELSAGLKTTISVSDDERIEILGAFGSGSGRWFKCRNGHPYVITECGGAMVRAVCPDCQAEIGGEFHQLLEDNELATDMDGAIEPLYPTALLRALPGEDMNAMD